MTADSRLGEPADTLPVDTLIVGGGPAGQSAALLLGRMGRRVTVIDAGQSRNRDAHTVRGFLAVEDLSPDQFRTAALRQLGQYPSITSLSAIVTGAAATANEEFTVTLDSGVRLIGRRLLLATGVGDVLPAVDGLAQSWGSGVYGCAYCHGWEARDRPLAVFGGEPDALISVAYHLRNLSADVLAIVPAALSAAQRAVAHELSIRTRVHEVVRVRSLGQQGIEIMLADGSAEQVAAAFVGTTKSPHSALAEGLGCELSDDGRVRVNMFGHTSVPGIFATGDVARTGIIAPQVISAAALGAQAGIAIDQDLLMTGIETVRRQVQQALAAAE
jgi:thioredoxin reductase